MRVLLVDEEEEEVLPNVEVSFVLVVGCDGGGVNGKGRGIDDEVGLELVSVAMVEIGDTTAAVSLRASRPCVKSSSSSHLRKSCRSFASSSFHAPLLSNTDTPACAGWLTASPFFVVSVVVSAVSLSTPPNMSSKLSSVQPSPPSPVSFSNSSRLPLSVVLAEAEAPLVLGSAVTGGGRAAVLASAFPFSSSTSFSMSVRLASPMEVVGTRDLEDPAVSVPSSPPSVSSISPKMSSKLLPRGTSFGSTIVVALLLLFFL